MGPSALPKRGGAPQFSAHVYCGQTTAWTKMPLGIEVGLGLRDTVLDGDPVPAPLNGHSPQFSVNVRCGQTAGWTKMSLLGMEVGIGQTTLCSMGTQLLQKKGTAPHPIFDPCLLWLNGRMDEDATWYGGRPRPRPHCIRRGPSSPQKGHSSPLSFRPMSIVATVAQLSYC